ncbi:MarR family winged helix-turn-helix transcriptional regulator [Levilactobacillus suantsaii]|uniref:MarR family transcriptional regulator n=1 Tax=Levilactobacillus suantsaii TaxID=2292255 RepID=A0A4Q0VJ11_9LACO|nr:MarR family transcriptional regulator [Levilactobacillus suantsaii]QMU07851.1 MarR family transcriptional regulator [Levilactobacillus suantsaii]RXI79481.1 MarR family transcriptional regulator [Levilactobacillus suantsaii]
MKNIGYLAQDISILHRQFYKETKKQFETLGLNQTAACILLVIGDNSQLTQNQVARLLVIDKALITREVTKMAGLDYLTKTAGTGKSKLLTLTATGMTAVQTIQQIRIAWWEEKFAATGITATSPLVPAIEAVVEHVVAEKSDHSAS